MSRGEVPERARNPQLYFIVDPRPQEDN